MSETMTGTSNQMTKKTMERDGDARNAAAESAGDDGANAPSNVTSWETARSPVTAIRMRIC